jgi:hypothetical protein
MAANATTPTMTKNRCRRERSMIQFSMTALLFGRHVRVAR